MNTLEKLDIVLGLVPSTSEYSNLAESIVIEVEDMMELIRALKEEIDYLEGEVAELEYVLKQEDIRYD